MTGQSPNKASVERGIKRQQVGDTEVIAPSNGKGKTNWEKAKLRKGFRRRAGIEPIIGHVKSDCGIERALPERRNRRPNQRHSRGKCVQFSELAEKSTRKHKFCHQLSANSSAILVTQAVTDNLSRDVPKAS